MTIAVLLLSFMEDLSILLAGINLGEFGTRIAFMVILISYKLIAWEKSQIKGEYFRYFTVTNV